MFFLFIFLILEFSNVLSLLKRNRLCKASFVSGKLVFFSPKNSIMMSLLSELTKLLG